MVQATYHRLTIVGKREITLNDQTVSYILKRSTRAQHVRLEIKRDTGLTVVIPEFYKTGQLADILQGKRGWILGKLSTYVEIQPLCARRELKSGDTITYLGRDLKVLTRQDYQDVDSVELQKNTLVVSLRRENDRLNVALEQWYRMQAAKLIKERADKLSARLGVSYNRLIIRGQKTRWGSCSRKGNLSFNWKLLMVPEPVIDYVIIHELAHLKEMNHTKRFWAIVAEYCPQWRKHRKWLRDFNIHLCDSSFLSLDERGFRACPELVEG